MKIPRRTFFKFAAGGALGVIFTPVPWKVIDDIAIWSQNWSWIPVPPRGEPITRFTACTLCPAGCAGAGAVRGHAAGVAGGSERGRPVPGGPGGPSSGVRPCPRAAANARALGMHGGRCRGGGAQRGGERRHGGHPGPAARPHGIAGVPALSGRCSGRAVPDACGAGGCRLARHRARLGQRTAGLRPGQRRGR